MLLVTEYAPATAEEYPSGIPQSCVLKKMFEG